MNTIFRHVAAYSTLSFSLGLFVLIFLYGPATYAQTQTELGRPTQANPRTPPPTAKPTAPGDGRRKASSAVSIEYAKAILPDLVIKQIKLLPGSGLNPKRGIKVLISNIGEADASSTFYLRLVIERASSIGPTGQSNYDGKKEDLALTMQPLAKGSARWVNFEALSILNDGSKNKIVSVTATVDSPRVVTTISGAWPFTETSKTEGPFIKESNEKNNTLSPDPSTIAP